MPMPSWLGRINRRVFDPLELARGVRPVITHVGRASGTTYRTPLDAPRVIDADEAWRVLPDTAKPPPRFLRIDKYLRMDVAGGVV